MGRNLPTIVKLNISQLLKALKDFKGVKHHKMTTAYMQGGCDGRLEMLITSKFLLPVLRFLLMKTL